MLKFGDDLPFIKLKMVVLAVCLGMSNPTGKEPKDDQPLSYDKKANFEDYGLVCNLLAGTQMYLLK